MTKKNPQVEANCAEMNGIIAMFAVDAKRPEDRMMMAGVLLANAIKLYLSANMDYQEIETVLSQAIPTFKKSMGSKKK